MQQIKALQMLQKPEDLMELLKGHRSIFVGAFCNEPQTLMQWFQKIVFNLAPMSLYMVVTGSSVSFAKNLPKHIDIKAFLSSNQFRKFGLTNQVDYIPMNLSEIPKWIETSNQVDVAFIQVSPPDAEGYCNTGISVDVIPGKFSRFAFSNPAPPISGIAVLVIVKRLNLATLPD